MSVFRAWSAWLGVLAAEGAGWAVWRVAHAGGERLTTFDCATEVPLVAFTSGIDPACSGGPADAICARVRHALQNSRFHPECGGRSLRLR